MLYVYKCEVKRVIDGDTLDLDIDLGFNVHIFERVRLYGIDTPELFGPTATEAGKLAKAFVEEWVSQHSELDGHFEYHSTKYDFKDKYGRGLGTIKFVSSDNEITDLVDQLVLNGHVK